MSVKELAVKLTDIATLFGNLEVRFANKDMSAPVIDVVFHDGAQFVTLDGGTASTGSSISMSVSDGLFVGERLG